MEKEKYIGSSKISEKPKRSFTFKLDEKCVKFKHLNPEISTELQRLKEEDDNLQNQINSLQVSGIALSNMFGDNPYIGICQKTLTEAINLIWSKIEDITGESILGFSWVVDPEYIISESEETISVTASPLIVGAKFEHIALYCDDVLLKEEDNVGTFLHSFQITDTSVIRLDAKILGVPYSRQTTVTHYNSFFLGAGSTYSEIMNISHVKPIANNMRGAYDVEVGEGQRIFIILGSSLRSGFIRADINGVEIPFTEMSVTVGGKDYKVLTSQNLYSAGTYNIDING